MMTDEELLGLLRTTAVEVDPVPEAVLAAASAALSTRRLDEELAELLMDSALETTAHVRSEVDDVRSLSFESASIALDLQVDYSAERLSLRGLVTGAAGTAVVESAERRHQVSIDEQGWFAVPDLPRGATRVRLRSTDGVAVTTGWVLL